MPILSVRQLYENIKTQKERIVSTNNGYHNHQNILSILMTVLTLDSE